MIGERALRVSHKRRMDIRRYAREGAAAYLRSALDELPKRFTHPREQEIFEQEIEACAQRLESIS